MDGEVTTKETIQGVLQQPLQVIQDERGAVLHMLRADSPNFEKFGEVYFSEVKNGVVKAWKRHRTMTQNFAVPIGRVKFVIYDDRSNSKTKGHTMACVLGRPDHYELLVVPPMLWYGFQGLGAPASLVANCSDIPHDPQDAEQIEKCPMADEYVW